MLPVSIQPAVRADFPDIAQLHAASWRNAYRSHLPASYLAERMEYDLADAWRNYSIQSGDVVHVARRKNDNNLLGFISVWCRPAPYIDNLHCDPSHTSRGIGSRLMRSAFEQLLRKGNSTASLSVLVGNNRARRFYIRLGGRVEARRREAIFGYPVDVELIRWDNLRQALHNMGPL